MKKILFIITLFISTLSYSVTYTSLVTGNWGTASTWNNGVPVDANGNIVTVKTGHTVTATNLVFNNQFTINVETGATLIINAVPITGDAITVKNNMVFNIANGGQVIINGNFKAQNNAILDVNGTLTIDGNLTAGNGSVLSGTGSVTVTGIVTGPAGFVGDSQLPIELIYFKAYYSVNSAILEWSTATETNNNYFTIEYSTDIINWEVLDYVSGADNSNSELKYTYAHITKNNYYYRLSQVDFDGKSETFNIVYVNTPYINEDNIYNVYDNMGRYITSGNFNEIKTRLKNGQIYYLKTEHETKVYIK